MFSTTSSFRPLFHQAARWGLALTLVALLFALGCGPSDPIEKIAEQRTHYTAELNSFIVDSQPVGGEVGTEEDATGEVGTGEDATGEDATPDGETAGEAPGEDGDASAGEGEAPEAVPVIQSVILDILLQSDLYEQLPGITLDVSHIDASGAEKGHYRIWQDTSTIVKGRGQSLTHRLEDVDYTEGDGFHVEVRHPIPEAERGEYRELSVAASGG